VRLATFHHHRYLLTPIGVGVRNSVELFFLEVQDELELPHPHLSLVGGAHSFHVPVATEYCHQALRGESCGDVEDRYPGLPFSLVFRLQFDVLMEEVCCGEPHCVGFAWKQHVPCGEGSSAYVLGRDFV